MKWLVYLLLALEAALVACALSRAIGGNLAVVLLAANSILLLWSATRWRRKPSCCR
jgi:hypothetical protein